MSSVLSDSKLMQLIPVLYVPLEGFQGGLVVKNLHPRVGKIPWRRAQQPTPVFLPGESHGQRSLAGYSPWDHKESDRTEHAHTHAPGRMLRYTSGSLLSLYVNTG